MDSGEDNLQQPNKYDPVVAPDEVFTPALQTLGSAPSTLKLTVASHCLGTAWQPLVQNFPPK